MKVAIIGAINPDSMECNFQEAITFRGDECQIFDIYDSFAFKSRYTKKIAVHIDFLLRHYFDLYDKKVFKIMFDRIVDYKPDIVFSFYRFVHPDLIHNIKKIIKCKVIQINPDALTTFEQQQIFISDYDVYFTKDPYIKSFMCGKLGLNAKLYTEAFNARLHSIPSMSKQQAEEETQIDVMTYGRLYPYRCIMMNKIIEAGIDVKLFGVKPNRFYNNSLNNAFTGKYIAGAEKAKILYGSKIVFNQMHYAEIEGVNERFVEANGCGAFQLCDYKPIVKDMLPIDSELVTFKTIDEGIDKIKYYLKHPQERYDIAKKVQNHFANNYSYDHLIDYILQNI